MTFSLVETDFNSLFDDGEIEEKQRQMQLDQNIHVL